MSKKKEKSAVSKNSGIFVLDLSNLMDGCSFESFAELRKEAYSFVKDYREHFVQVVLNNHKIPYHLKMSKREKQELFEKHIVGIIHDQKKNYDKIYKEGNLIAYWNKNIELKFKKGKLLCTIQFKVF